MSKKRSSRNKKEIKRNYIALIVIIAILVSGIYYIKEIEKNEAYESAKNAPSNELYHVLENNDTINNIKRIELGKNMNILDISQIFYQDKIFWPYIIKLNQHITNPLDIPKGTIITVPKVDAEFLDLNATENVARVKTIGDSILNEVNERRKPKVLD